MIQQQYSVSLHSTSYHPNNLLRVFIYYTGSRWTKAVILGHGTEEGHIGGTPEERRGQVYHHRRPYSETVVINILVCHLFLVNMPVYICNFIDFTLIYR